MVNHVWLWFYTEQRLVHLGNRKKTIFYFQLCWNFKHDYSVFWWSSRYFEQRNINFPDFGVRMSKIETRHGKSVGWWVLNWLHLSAFCRINCVLRHLVKLRQINFVSQWLKILSGIDCGENSLIFLCKWQTTKFANLISNRMERSNVDANSEATFAQFHFFHKSYRTLTEHEININNNYNNN